MTPIEVVRHPNGKWKQNCFVAGFANGDALVVDPGSDAEGIADHIERRGWKPLAVLNTHAHYDHVGAVADIAERYGIPFYLHRDDRPLLLRANLYRLIFDSRVKVRIPDVSREFGPDDRSLRFGDIEVDVIQTPGHTEGSICLLMGDCLFTGDTLLPGAIGRTDLPGGNAVLLHKSLRTLLALPHSLKVFPGHGRETSLAAELAANPALREAAA